MALRRAYSLSQPEPLQIDGNADLDEARRHARQFTGAFRLEHLFKITLLALMIFKF